MQPGREHLPFAWTFRDTGITAVLTLGGVLAGGWGLPLAASIWPAWRIGLWADQCSTVQARWVRATFGIVLPSFFLGVFLHGLGGFLPSTDPKVWIGLWLVLVMLNVWTVVSRLILPRKSGRGYAARRSASAGLI